MRLMRNRSIELLLDEIHVHRPRSCGEEEACVPKSQCGCNYQRRLADYQVLVTNLSFMSRQVLQTYRGLISELFNEFLHFKDIYTSLMESVCHFDLK